MTIPVLVIVVLIGILLEIAIVIVIVLVIVTVTVIVIVPSTRACNWFQTASALPLSRCRSGSLASLLYIING